MYEVDPAAQQPPAEPVRRAGREQARSEALAPVEVYRPEGRAPVLLLCDHAGRVIPEDLGDLGVAEADRRCHIGWDIGAADVARHLADLLDAPLVLGHVSRLVIDVNRRPYRPTSVPEVSDGTPVPGNRGLGREELRRRIRLAFLPYHRTIARRLAAFRREGRVPAVVTVHSCTPVMAGVHRPWQIGVMWNRDGRLALPVLQALRLEPGLSVGENQPYSGRSGVGYTAAFHAERTGLPNVQFEVRQDLIDAPEKALPWARRLAEALRGPLADPTLYRVRRF